MSNSYGSLCDDFYQDMYVHTELELPRERDTILYFFERIQKQYPSMGNFICRDNNDYILKGDSSQYGYRWICLEVDRIGSGVVNPKNLEAGYQQHRLVLDVIPYLLHVSHLDIRSVDVTFCMDFECSGSHDEVISEALFGSSAFDSLFKLPSARPVGLAPFVVVALTEDGRTQARVSVESKSSRYIDRRKEEPEGEAISLSFTIRQYPGGEEKFNSLKSFEQQCRAAEQLMAEKIVPNFVQPLNETISQERLR